MDAPKQIQVIFVVGATAVGKSALALELAARRGGVIVNGDSLQFYRGLDIGTAKATPAERARAPHFLLDIRAPDQPLSAAAYRREALALLAKQTGFVFVVGGSGFYLQALQKGVFAAPPVTAATEQRLMRQTPAALHAELQRCDPVTAARLDPPDVYRVRRALGVFVDTGRLWSDLQKRFRPEPFPYPLRKIGLELPRATLRQRIGERTRRMLAVGFIEEVEALITQGYGETAPLASVGYKEVRAFLRGELPRGQLANAIAISTGQLAKRQVTWFRRESDIEWFSEAETARRSLLQPHT